MSFASPAATPFPVASPGFQSEHDAIVRRHDSTGALSERSWESRLSLKVAGRRSQVADEGVVYSR